MRCGGVVVLYWAYWPRLADVVIRGGAVRSPPARSSPRAARSSQRAARIGSTFWKPRAGAAAPMGSCKLGWSGNSISFSVVSDVSYVRWLLVAALRAPRLSSRRALAVARACCPIEVVVAAQLVTFVWSVAGVRRVAAVAPAAHAAATAGRPVATKCAHADLTFLLVSSGTCDCCKPPAIFVLPDEHCRFRTRRRPKSASRLCHHHQSHLVSSSRVAIERESSELVAPTFRALY